MIITIQTKITPWKRDNVFLEINEHIIIFVKCPSPKDMFYFQLNVIIGIVSSWFFFRFIQILIEHFSKLLRVYFTFVKLFSPWEYLFNVLVLLTEFLSGFCFSGLAYFVIPSSWFVNCDWILFTVLVLLLLELKRVPEDRTWVFSSYI